MTMTADKTFQLTVYVKAVHCVKWRHHCRLGPHFCTVVGNATQDVEFEFDEIRDVLTGEWGRVVVEVNA